jgi:membrane-associated phospholipid phosphatase
MQVRLSAAILILAFSAAAQDQTAITVQPAAPAIQNKDLWDDSGIVHPFRRMPRYIWHDQKAIWTSPFHTAKRDIKWWLIFGGATAALIASDRWTTHHLPNSPDQITAGTWGSRIGAAYTLIPLSAGFYFIGSKTGDQRFRETGMIAFETLIDANIVGEVLKLATSRARPLQGDGNGGFESASNPLTSSFPSGHAITTWALASVVAHEYPKPAVQIAAYGLASAVTIARVGARRHFPGDVLAGSALGWFIGDYLYGKRHNRELDRKPSAVRNVLDHVRLGVTVE